MKPEILMDESEFAKTDLTDDELREMLYISPKLRDFFLIPRVDDE